MKSDKIGTNGAGALTLEQWIDEVGAASVARLIKVDPSAVRHWRRGHCLPRSSQMLKIHRFSRGRVSYAEMIETFYRNQARLAAKKTAQAR